jgi:transcriptional regulator with XRE-family HTH domain
VPMSHFWNSSADSGPKPASDFGDFMVLRQRIIGALLSQARLQAKVTVEDMAQELGVEGDLIGAYEAGERPIPLFELEQMGKVLEVPLDYFSETGHGPLARHEVEQKIQRRFDELPPEVKAFVTEPINLSYLETAMRLSELDVHRLRSIAEGILDITF